MLMRSFPAIIVLVLALSGSAATANECERGERTRVLTKFKTSFVLSQSSTEWGLCIKHYDCTWGTRLFSDAMVAGFGPYTTRDDGTCTSSFDGVGNHPWTCKPEFEKSQVADSLTALLRVVPGACKDTQKQLWSVQVGNDVFAILDLSELLSNNDYCVAMIVRMRDLQPFLVVSGNCPDETAAQQVVASIDVPVLQDFSSIIAVDSTGRGFAQQFNVAEIRVWGGLDENGIKDWLAAVNSAAHARVAFASTHSAPLKLDDSGYQTRLVQWFAAAVGRLDHNTTTRPDARDRSKEARDWMAANVLTREEKFKGTLFRPELMAP